MFGGKHPAAVSADSCGHGGLLWCRKCRGIYKGRHRWSGADR